MKHKLFIALCTIGLVMTSCSNNENQTPTDEESAAAVAAASREQLVEAVADRDSLLGLVNDIQSGMDQIKQLENILSMTQPGTETQSQRASIQADIQAIQATLEQRRKRLEELEAKLKNSNLNNAKLQQTIATLKEQIDNQNRQIEQLTQSLNEANEKIGELNQSVDSLNTTVSNVTTERDKAQAQSVQLADELNTCYYVYAKKSELKEHKIIETGFLRKTKLMAGEFDSSFFVKGDKRTLFTIPLHSKKAKILSNQPAGSYTLNEEGGQMVLRITNPTQFWSLSNYLVVQTD